MYAVSSDIWVIGKSDSGVKQIKRKEPFVEKDATATELCTVYVENLPPYATIDALNQLFSTFGKVEYVSLPRYELHTNG